MKIADNHKLSSICNYCCKRSGQKAMSFLYAEIIITFC